MIRRPPRSTLFPDTTPFRSATGRGAVIDADAALELPAVHKSGRALTIELTLSAIEGPPIDGRFVLAIIRDATARKLAEEQRVQDRKSTRLNSSHANISYAVF